MSKPGLRQPKLGQNSSNTSKNIPTDRSKYKILTLKNGTKIVVSCDAYNGIIMTGDMFKCVFCDKEIEKEISKKENHKKLAEHKRCRLKYPHLEDLSENLVRQINSSTCYCTICNVVTLTATLTRHITSEQHMCELDKAINRSAAYTPVDNNN